MITGTGFQSKGSYLFGHFSMHIKLPAGDTAGVVTAFYVSLTANLKKNVTKIEILILYQTNKKNANMFV